jgi:hypothetical protein
MTRREPRPIGAGGRYAPLIDQPRDWETIRVGAVGDARWRNVQPRVRHINSARALELQRKARGR